MMNDRFSAELRKHLLETANDRPADGQLGALLDRVETTRQRPPILARLTWTPGRIGPVPSAAIRYALIAVALALAVVAGALLAGGGGGGRTTVFEGSWITIDPADGSGMSLVVGAGMSPPVYFEDGYASGAACVADAVKRFTARGTATIVGNVLNAAYPEGGGCGLIKVGVAGRYEYVHDSDTLHDQDGVIWSRALGGDTATPPPAKQPSATQPPPTLAPLPELTPNPTPGSSTGTSECIDLAQGGTFTAPAGRLSVTATIPEKPAIPWQGLGDAFFLSGACGRGTPITLFASTETEVFATSCMPGSLEVTSFADAVARLDTPKGDDIADRVDLTIDGHPAARYDITNLSTCPAGFGLWNGTILGPGETGSVYVIDVDGVLLAIELNRNGSQTPTELEEAWAIVASLQIAH